MSCEDGRAFILEAAARLISEPFPPYSGPKLSKSQENKERRKQRSAAKQTDDTSAAPRAKISHFVMNLPDSAIEFLDAFRGIFSSIGKQHVANVYSAMPMIHCHCFTRELEPDKARVDILKVGLFSCLFALF